MTKFITVNTDASYCHKTKVGGWAMWIRGDDFVYKMSGAFKDYVLSSAEAELKAVKKALYVLEKNLHDYDVLIINTDCEGNINKIKRLVELREYEKKLNDRIGSTIRPRSVRVRHVKAHTKVRSARGWINKWCDSNARKEMRNARDLEVNA